VRHGRDNRVSHRRFRGLAWLATSGLLVCCGCTRVPRPTFDGGWNPVPSLSWRSPQEAAAAKPTPTVSANAGSVGGPTSNQIATIGDPPQYPIEDDLRGTRATDNISVDPFLETEERPIAQASESRVQKLRQALTADARRAAESAPSEDEQSPLRLRIDALLRKSTQQRDDGQLAEARSTAQRAAELAEEAKISFLPTELRPSDLLRQLTDTVDRAAPEASLTDAPVFSPTLALTANEVREPSVTLAVTGGTGPNTVPEDQRHVEQEAARAIGVVAANRPMQLSSRSPRDKTNTPERATLELPDVVKNNADNASSPDTRSATRDLLMSRATTSGPELRLPDHAPEPASIDPLEPLPKFRPSSRSAKPLDIAPLEAIPWPGVGLRGWSLWGPILSLGAIAIVVGLGLASRTFWIWRRAHRSQ
jgi:hypothetical protein